MTRPVLSLALSLAVATAPGLLAARGPTILLVVRDTESHPIAGVRLVYQEVKSGLTNRQGETELNLPAGVAPGNPIGLALASGAPKTEDWFLVAPTINVPDPSSPAAVVLMRRSTFRLLAREALEAATALRPGPQTARDRQRALEALAARYGLKPGLVEAAVRSFAETQDLNDRAIAAYLSGQYALVETILGGPSEKVG